MYLNASEFNLRGNELGMSSGVTVYCSSPSCSKSQRPDAGTHSLTDALSM